MHGNIRLGRVAGVRIALHYSWFLIALLLTLSIGASFRGDQSGLGAHPAVLWTVAALTGILFFATLVLHELAHALAARASGLPVRSVTLFALGGVSHIDGEPERARTELLIGIVGPLTSLAIGLACLGVAAALGWSFGASPSGPVLAVLVWLGSVNLVLAAFNMLPGYPLDGGRVLRAGLWWLTGDRGRATRWAAAGGQAMAFLLIALGILEFFAGAGIGGLWLAFIGWFLLSASSASAQTEDALEKLRGLTVGDAMSRDCGSVDARRPLRDFVEGEIMRSGQRCFVVHDGDDSVAGLVTLHEIGAVPRREWEGKRVADVMKPLEGLRSVAPGDPLAESLRVMGQENVQQLPVVEHGRLAGVLTRGDILRVLRARRDLAA
jgi:Zn-dependent protease/CBS domain-containing protein